MTACLVPGPGDRACAATSVVVVEGDYLGKDGLPNKGKAAAAFQSVVHALKAGQVPLQTTSDSLVERAGLPQAAVAIFPYNRAMSDGEMQQVERFVANGGKVIACFTGHRNLLQLLGVRPTGLITLPPARPLTSLCLQEALLGAPSDASWPADLIAQVESQPGTRLLASWGSTAYPAALANETGIFVAAVPSPQSSVELWQALCAALAPGLWKQIVVTEPGQIGPLGPFASLADLAQYVRGQNDQAAFALAGKTIDEALASLAQARDQLQANNITAALATAQKAQQHAHLAYWQSYASVAGELRGVWMCNSVEPSWSQAMRELAAANFNAVFPYMMSGGVAFYRSRVLPIHSDVINQGDYLAQALAAARTAGVPVHARMLNLSTLFAPSAAKAALRQQGRLMVTSAGKSVDWLCPTNPANRRAQVAAALEMADYGVAGIQFDYMRYPSANSCFCANCRAKFLRDTGLKVAHWPADVVSGCYRGRFADWRREQITSLVGEITTALRQAHPGIYVSAAVFLNWEDHRETFGQDWKAWVDRGYVDFVCPMNYTTRNDRFTLYVSRQQNWISDRVPYATGIGINADGFDYPGPELAAEQIRIAREHGAKGFVVFNYDQKLVRDYLPWLKLGVTREPTCFDCRAGSAR